MYEVLGNCTRMYIPAVFAERLVPPTIVTRLQLEGFERMRQSLDYF